MSGRYSVFLFKGTVEYRIIAEAALGIYPCGGYSRKYKLLRRNKPFCCNIFTHGHCRLKMVNGVILVVDAFEGPMPQTKFVLRKALELQLSVIVCVNKIDRPEARPIAVVDEVLELFMDLDANDEQLDCPFVFASAKTGSATLNLTVKNKDMKPLFDTILDYIPAPEGDPDAGTQLLVSTIDYNEYVGRIGVGKVDNGCLLYTSWISTEWYWLKVSRMIWGPFPLS